MRIGCLGMRYSAFVPYQHPLHHAAECRTLPTKMCNCESAQTGLGYSAVPLLSGDAGVAQTIELMRKLIDAGVKDPKINQYAIDALRNSGAPQHDPLSAAKAIFDTVSANFYFVNDPVGPSGTKETLRWPRVTLELKAGDCDDFTVLICSLLGTIGESTRIVTVASDPRDPQQFTHVYPEVEINGDWIPVDVARPGAQFGLAPEHVYRKKIWSCTDSSAAEVSGVRHSLAGYVRMMTPRHRQMGDDSIASDITAGAQGAADIILASNAAPQNIYGTVTTGQNSLSTLPAGYNVNAINPATGLPYSYSYGSSLLTPTTLSPTFVVVGLGLLALLLLRR